MLEAAQTSKPTAEHTTYVVLLIVICLVGMFAWSRNSQPAVQDRQETIKAT